MSTPVSSLRRALPVLGVIAAIVHSRPVEAQSILDIQPVQICQDDGSACRTIGTDFGAVGDFWYRVAGITLNVLPQRTFNSTTYWSMENTDEVRNFLLAQPSPDAAGPIGFSMGPLTVWYSRSEVFQAANGVIGGNRSWVSSELSQSFQDIFTAQVLGLNLGLNIIIGGPPENIMKSVINFGDALNGFTITDEQRVMLQSSRFLREAPPASVPEPSSALLAAVALGGLFVHRSARRRANT